MTRLDPNHLQALTAVADTGSFTQAARHLCRTQSAVSTQVRKLETNVGKRLLDRQVRRARLTEDGELLVGYARRLLELDDEARAVLSRPAMEGLVRLGVPDDYAHRFLPEVLARFTRAHPRVRVEVIGALSGALLEQFESGQLDVAVITKQPDRSGGETVRREPLVWAAARHQVSHLRAPIPLALFPQGCVFRASALAALNRSGQSWSVAYCSQSFAGGEIAVDSGHAVTVMLASMVPERWRTLGPEDGFPALPEAEVELCRRTAPDQPAADHLGAWIAERLPRE